MVSTPEGSMVSTPEGSMVSTPEGSMVSTPEGSMVMKRLPWWSVGNERVRREREHDVGLTLGVASHGAASRLRSRRPHPPARRPRLFQQPVRCPQMP